MKLEEIDAGQALETVPAASLTLHGNINDAVNLAQLMAKAKVALPAHLHNNPGECLAIVMMAQTWGMNPYMVGQKTSVINNRLMYEGQLVNAVVNRSGFLTGRLTYEVEGEGEQLVATVTGLLRGEAVPRQITIGMPKTGEARNSPLWKTQPEQQLLYKAVRMWARRHIPEVLLGVYTPEDDHHDLPREMVEVKESNARAVENRMSMIASSPMLALDPEIVAGVERLEAQGDVFTRSTTPAPKQKEAEEPLAGLGQSAASPKATAAASADLFSQHDADHSGKGQAALRSTEDDMARQDFIDAGHPVVEGVVLTPATDYAAVRVDLLRKIALALLDPSSVGLERTADAFEMVGGRRVADALEGRDLVDLSQRLRQFYGA